MQDICFGLTMPRLVLYGALAASAIVMAIWYIRAEKPLRTALKGAVPGGAALLLLHFFGGGTGLALPLNFLTAFISLTLGLPGTAAMALIELLTR